MDRCILTADEALTVLEIDDGWGHSFRQGGPVLMGADMPFQNIENAIRQATWVEISGDMARRMKHGVCAFNGGPTYFETNEDKLKALEDSITDEERQRRFDDLQVKTTT